MTCSIVFPENKHCRVPFVLARLSDRLNGFIIKHIYFAFNGRYGLMKIDFFRAVQVIIKSGDKKPFAKSI
jgi:hypothetical protein